MKLSTIVRREAVRQGRRRVIRAVRKSGRHHAKGSRRRTAGAALVLVAAVAAGALAAGLLHADVYPRLGTYGVDAGTSARYCSLDLVRWHLEESCETAN